MLILIPEPEREARNAARLLLLSLSCHHRPSCLCLPGELQSPPFQPPCAHNCPPGPCHTAGRGSAAKLESDRAPPGRPRISAFSACRSQMRCHSWCYSCFSSSSSLSSLPSQLLTQDLLPHWPPCLCSLNGWSSFLSLRLFLLFSLPGMLFSQFLERRVLLTTWSQQRGAP